MYSGFYCYFAILVDQYLTQSLLERFPPAAEKINVDTHNQTLCEERV